MLPTEPIVTYDKLVERFPSMKPKSFKIAKGLLPLCPSPELAAVVAALMTDGHIDWYTSDDRPRTRKIILYSSKKTECELFLKTCKAMFGTEGKVMAYLPKYGCFKKQPYKTIINNACIARVLILCGVPAGDKTKKEFLIPDWITNGTDEIKRQFLRTFFNFEGGVPSKRKDRKHAFQMMLSMNKTQELLENGMALMNQIIELLGHFNVSCCKAASGCYDNGFTTDKLRVFFTIVGQIPIVNFYRNVGFLNPDKQSRLEQCVLDISNFHRIKSAHVCKLLSDIKNAVGTDKNLSFSINKHTIEKYTPRQIEHFRRMESAVPLEVVYSLISLNGSSDILKELPEYVTFLRSVASNAPSSH